MNGKPQKKIYWSLILVFFYFSVAAGMAGYAFFLNEKRETKQEKWTQLDAILALKSKAIADWREGRKADGAAIFEDPFVAFSIQRFLQDPNETGSRQKILGWMKSLQRLQQTQSYTRIVLLDPTMTGRLSVPQGQTVLDSVPQKNALEAAQERKVILSDFYRDSISNSIRLSLFVPIVAQREGTPRAVAVVCLEIDPAQVLYPMIQNWPTPSRTSEALLVRREGNEIIFLNELRHRKKTALMLHFPVSKSDLLAAKAVHGEEGIVEGVDYRGVPVLGAIGPIADSPWFVVAKVDQQEIYAPIETQARIIGVFIAGFIIIVAFAIGFVWQGQYLQEHRFFEERIDGLKRELESFTYFVAGDLRTSTLGIEGLSRVVLEKSSGHLDDQARESLNLIRQESQNMLQLIGDLMVFSRIDESNLTPSRIDMAEIGRAVLNELKTRIPTEGLKVDFQESCPTWGDREMIMRVLYNLLSYAVQAAQSKSNAMIEMGCKTESNEDIFYIKEDGGTADLSSGGSNRVEPLPGSTSQDMRVGFAIVQRIVQRQGGRVWVEAGPNDGSTFYFTLPKGAKP